MSDLEITEEQANRIVRTAEFELALEQQRRVVRPEAPSRLSCVFVAEDTPAGRTYAQTLATMQGFVMIVEVPFALRSARVDAHWLGDSLDPLSDDAMRGYWSGEAQSDHEPLWEWLVDGVIKCVDPEQFELLRAHNRRAGDVIPGAAGLMPPAS
jgi:hypothetical protein